MPIANYTTDVSAMRSLGEISGMLVTGGAQAVMTEYEGQLPSSISFRLERDSQNLHFRLPADWRAVQVVLKKQGIPPSGRTDEQSQRVAWRIVRDWLRAQLALVEANCAKVEQVMLPYLVDDAGQTLYQRLEASKFTQFALPVPQKG